MDFTLSPEQQQIKERAARVAREVMAPRAAASDREGTYPEDYMAAFREAGLLGLGLPREYGGAGAGTIGLALAVEEVAKYDSGAGLLLLLTRLVTASIAMAGAEEQKQRYVRGVATGEMRGCFALTEPEAGSDAASIGTTATAIASAAAKSGPVARRSPTSRSSSPRPRPNAGRRVSASS
jgi:alkylation response protein AidB-like acyl-CoA dehydrogenase